MKRIFFLLPLVAAFGLPAVPVNAQATDRAAQIAERQEIEEKYKSLAAAVQALQESNTALQKKLDAALGELNDLRDKTAKQPRNLATQEDIKRLTDAITEVENNRQSDNKKWLEKIAELGKALKAPPPPAPRKTNETSSATRNEKGYDYIVESGDTLGKIIRKYKENGIKVSQKAIEEANPDVNWTKLKIGQKIWVPAPKE